MKKVFILLSMILTFLTFINFKTYASETDANLNGLEDVYGFEYIADTKSNSISHVYYNSSNGRSL